MGGSLHQELHLVGGRFDHRSDTTLPYRDRYLPKHPVRLTDGWLRSIVGEDAIQVNSLHMQAIDRLAPGLTPEAHAEDGTVEAVTVTGARGFTLGVQWHPEWTLDISEASKAIFKTFGEACAAHQKNRPGSH
jgi:putative glutamine amidotransferase